MGNAGHLVLVLFSARVAGFVDVDVATPSPPLSPLPVPSASLPVPCAKFDAAANTDLKTSPSALRKLSTPSASPSPAGQFGRFATLADAIAYAEANGQGTLTLAPDGTLTNQFGEVMVYDSDGNLAPAPKPHVQSPLAPFPPPLPPPPSLSTAPAALPTASCGARWDRCGGSGWHGATDCCTAGDSCYVMSSGFSQCRPSCPSPSQSTDGTTWDCMRAPTTSPPAPRPQADSLATFDRAGNASCGPSGSRRLERHPATQAPGSKALLFVPGGGYITHSGMAWLSTIQSHFQDVYDIIALTYRLPCSTAPKESEVVTQDIHEATALIKGLYGSVVAVGGSAGAHALALANNNASSASTRATAQILVVAYFTAVAETRLADSPAARPRFKPLSFISAATPSTYLIYGGQDQYTEMPLYQEYSAALSTAGVSNDKQYIADGTHSSTWSAADWTAAKAWLYSAAIGALPAPPPSPASPPLSAPASLSMGQMAAEIEALKALVADLLPLKERVAQLEAANECGRFSLSTDGRACHMHTSKASSGVIFAGNEIVTQG